MLIGCPVLSVKAYFFKKIILKAVTHFKVQSIEYFSIQISYNCMGNEKKKYGRTVRVTAQKEYLTPI